MRVLSLLLQACGCVGGAVGVFVLAGAGVGLVVAGLVAVTVGAVLEHEYRKT